MAIGTRWDAIVIGSGASGLATAAFLGKSGMKVLVLEKHSTAGGACHTFNDKGYEFNIGIHYVGLMDNPAFPAKIILDQVTDGQVQWAPMGKYKKIRRILQYTFYYLRSQDSDFDVVYTNAMSPLQRRFNISSPRGKWQEQLVQDFPNEKAAIMKFFDMAGKITRLNATMWMIALKIMPFWFVNLCDKLGIIRFFSPFFAFNHKRTLQDIVNVYTNNSGYK